MVFTVSILLVIWLFLIVFLETYYKYIKTNEMKKAVNTIQVSYGSLAFHDILDRLAVINNMCIIVTDRAGNVLYSKQMLAGQCYIHSENMLMTFGLKNKLLDSGKDALYFDVNNDILLNKTLACAIKLKIDGELDGFAFLNTLVVPAESTITIIKKQLLIITIIVFGLAFIITLFISNKISKPIVNITKSAKKFAKGDYSIDFDSGGEYLEVQQLASTLNHAGREISKVDNLRKELIANASHDIRTPLTIIKAYAEMIRDLSGDNKEKREQHINVIIDESNRLSKLVTGLLELSQLETGNTKLNISEFNITELLQDVLSRYQIYQERDGYTFELILSDEVSVKADKARIEQVLYNFINNAVNYTGEDKKVIIEQINTSDGVRIEITDTGDGIKKDMLPVVFDRYYREKKYEREVIGSGIGLSIVKQILKLHQFPFGVQSSEGNGSTFWFEIKQEPTDLSIK